MIGFTKRRHKKMWEKAYSIYKPKSDDKQRKKDAAAHMTKLVQRFNTLPPDEKKRFADVGGLLAFGLSDIFKRAVERSMLR